MRTVRPLTLPGGSPVPLRIFQISVHLRNLRPRRSPRLGVSTLKEVDRLILPPAPAASGLLRAFRSCSVLRLLTSRAKCVPVVPVPFGLIARRHVTGGSEASVPSGSSGLPLSVGRRLIHIVFFPRATIRAQSEIPRSSN